MAKANVTKVLIENIRGMGWGVEKILVSKTKKLSAQNPKMIFAISVSPRGKAEAFGWAGWSSVPIDTPATRGTISDFGGLFRDGKIVKVSRGYQNKLNRYNSKAGR